MLSAGILLLIVTAALLAPWIAPYDPTAQLDIVALKNMAPSRAHWLGTDPFSRDLFSRALYGARTSLQIALTGSVVALGIALSCGVGAGMAGPRGGDAVMRAVDAMRAIPRKMVLLAVVLIVPRASASVLALLLGVTSWMALAQVIFAQVRAVRTSDFVAAANALGSSRTRIAVWHVLPQLTGTVSATSALLVADMLGVEAGLSFLGLGVRAPQASWGTMLQDGLPYIGTAWWIVATPCVLLVVTVLCTARIADALHGLQR
jgi:peptide/nickel transport system permease protein